MLIIYILKNDVQKNLDELDKYKIELDGWRI